MQLEIESEYSSQSSPRRLGKPSLLGLSLPSSTSSYYYYSQPADADEAYAVPTFLPNLTLGWRRQRLTLLLDGQIYRRERGGFDFSDLFFAGNCAVRLGLSYRLGRNPDWTARP